LTSPAVFHLAGDFFSNPQKTSYNINRKWGRRVLMDKIKVAVMEAMDICIESEMIQNKSDFHLLFPNQVVESFLEDMLDMNSALDVDELSLLAQGYMEGYLKGGCVVSLQNNVSEHFKIRVSKPVCNNTPTEEQIQNACKSLLKGIR
jgi:hypothetical protein